MQINIFAKNTSLDEPLRVFVNDKIGILEKMIGHGRSIARVEIGLPSKHHRSGKIFYAEINLKIDGKFLRASSQHEDLRTAIIDARGEIQRQLKKLKTKKKDFRRKLAE